MRSRTAFMLTVAVIAAAAPAHALVRISTNPTRGMNCTGGVCTPTAASANLNANDLMAMLASGDVTVESSSAANNIAVDAALSWVAATRLTLDSYRSIAVNQPVVVQGPGALTLTTNDGGTGGDLQFKDGGTAGFWDLSSSLIVDGTAYTLVPDVTTLAGAVASDPKGSYALSTDYDASADGVYAQSPVAKDFRGNFDGLGHTISNLSIADPSRRVNTADALFKHTGHQASIRDLALNALSVSGGQKGFLAGVVATNDGAIVHVRVQGRITGLKDTEIIGGVAGQNYGRIRDASFNGDVSGYTTEGGIAGWNYGTIGDSRSSGTVSSVYVRPTGDPFVGGLAGFNGYILNGFSGGKIIASHSSSAVSAGIGESSVGGLVGGSKGFIWKSSASGSVSFPGGFGAAGGLVGLNLSLVQESFATGAVSAGDTAATGGFVGDNGDGTVENSYALGSVQVGSGGYEGGFVGANGRGSSGTVESSYSIGAVTGGAKDVGGFVGLETGSQVSTYWDLDTSGVSDPSRGAGNIANDPGLTGLSDSALTAALPPGLAAHLWRQDPSINNGYPFLRSNPPTP